METSKTITRRKPELKSQRYDELRELGLRHIQELSRKIWTDYNTHDPGVTMLEVLCYAITDLGHRAGQNIEDILAPEPKGENKSGNRNFYTAAEILPSRPITLDDLRKIIIDTAVDEITSGGEVVRVGVKNAWIETGGEPEVPVWAKKSRSKLQTEPKSGENTNKGRLDIAPLYEVLLEFDHSEKLGDLNRNIIREGFSLSGVEIAALRQTEARAEIVFPRWDTGDTDWDDPEDVLASAEKPKITFRNLPAGYSLIINFDDQNRPVITGTDQDGQSLVLDSVLELVNSKLDEWVAMYMGRVDMVGKILARLKARLHANRGLCEDFVRFTALRVESISIGADVELSPEADVHETEAEILHGISGYLSPEVRFLELDEMLDRELPTEEIFEGPLLDHGFIPDDKLRAAGRRKVIYVSDLIQIIMNIEGVTAVRHIEVANQPEIPDPEVKSRSVKWCLELAWERNYVPRLSAQNSSITYYKEDLPFRASSPRVEAQLEQLREQSEKTRPPVRLRDLRAPQGSWLGLDRYTSISEDFPSAWGIGSDGLSPAADQERKAQVMQLKGYLMFFEQLLANYMSQLAGVRELFSMNAAQDGAGRFEIGKTYFTQALNEVIPNGKTLFTDQLNHTVNLQQAAEDDESFVRRRNAFLDHLMARFAENFTDYATLTRIMAGMEGKKNLIRDKLAFLNHYPDVSSGRGLGFNYRDCRRIWHPDNRSGLQKNVSLKTGMEWPAPALLEFSPAFSCLPSGEGWEIRISDGGSLLMQSGEGEFGTKEEALEALELIVISGTQPHAFSVSETKGEFMLQLSYGLDGVLHSAESFNTEAGAEALMDQVHELCRREFYENAEAGRKNLAAPIQNYFDVDARRKGKTYRIKYKLTEKAFSFANEHILMKGETSGSGESAADTASIMELREEEFIWDVVLNGASKDRYRYVQKNGKWVLMLCGTGGEVLGHSVRSDFNDLSADQLNGLSEKKIRFEGMDPEVEGIPFESAAAEGPDVIITLSDGHGIEEPAQKAGYKVEFPISEAFEGKKLKVEGDAGPLLHMVESITLHLPEAGDLEKSETNLQIDFLEKKEDSTFIHVKQNLPEWRDGAKITFLRFFGVISLSGDELTMAGGMENYESARLASFFATKFHEREGIHLTEHLLLRPKEADDALLPIFIDPDCLHCQLDNPYSHVCSVVMPYWPIRFRNMDFRRFLERKIREETPAHVFVKICWVSNRQMQEYENAKKRWLLEACGEATGENRAETLEELISVLFGLRNVYPTGRLHDCEDPETLEEAIFLNNSTLGNT